MGLTAQQLQVSIANTSVSGLLETWRWLVDDTFTPMFATVLGDLFLRDTTGRIHWLDVGMGQLAEVAENQEELAQLLTQPDTIEAWFMPSIAEVLLSRHTLEPGHCFGYKVPPALGGTLEPENFDIFDLATHFSLQGQIQEQEHTTTGGSPLDGIEMEEWEEP